MYGKCKTCMAGSWRLPSDERDTGGGESGFVIANALG